MKASAGWIALAVAVCVVGFDAGFARAQDAAALVEKRQAAMKQQGRDLGTVKAFLEGKGELAVAQAGGADLVKSVSEIPSLFPAKTSMEDLPGKSFAKPEIWTEPDKFTAAAKTAKEKTEALEAALKGGDKAAISAAFDAVVKGGLFDPTNACGGCHKPFREKKPT